jgi:TPR repeat protein
LLKAAELGNVEAMYCLAHCYEKGLHGFKSSQTNAFAWFLESGSKNYYPALLEVVRFFTTGAEDGSVQVNDKGSEEYMKRIPNERLEECRKTQKMVSDLLSNKHE